ncbi:MAG TPA: CHAD domain-containing protein [Pseudonocardia sp.]|nr:CHAD domain-containing protein [Pseudonocardia sp.]
MSVAPLPPRPSEPATVDPAAAPVEHVRASLEQRLQALLAHEPGTRTGQDIEDLHQMRVAVRRMRATLKAAQPLLDTAWADDLRAELGWLGGALGPVRDLDVLLLRLHREIAGLPAAEQSAGGVLLDALERERTTARAAMLDALTTPRYFALLERLADTVRAPLPAPAPGDAAEPALVDLVRAEARKLRRAVARAGDDPADEVLHALRIRGKRVRYTGELVAPSLRGTPAGRSVKRLLTATTALQEVLGDHQDACVAEQRIRGLLASLDVAPDTVFVAGRLVEREIHRAAEKRREWRGAWVLVDARIAEV